MTAPKIAVDGGAFIERPPGNPALEPEPARPVERTYKVVGSHEVFGHEPGETFTATLPLEHEARLIGRGSLKHAAAKSAAVDTKAVAHGQKKEAK